MKHTLTAIIITLYFTSAIFAQNVGIGTTAPKVKLHVVNGVPLVDPYIGSTMALQTDGETMLHILSGSNSDQGSIVFGNTQQPISAGIQFNTFTPNDLSFYTNASLATLTINNLGNVGIHTVGPKAAFNVAAGKTVLFGADSSGAGSKMIWYPSKSAFRAGSVNGTQWDFNNIGKFSTAVGFGTKASGDYSTATGWGNIASGNYSTAMGIGTTASGDYSIALGSSTAASGNSSTAIGYSSIAAGHFSSAIGYYSIANSFSEMAVGTFNTSYTPLSTTNWNANDRLFVIGNGDNFNRSDAMVILKNGNTGIGESNPVFPMNFKSNLGDKISLWGNVANGSSIGFGVQPALFQIHSYQSSDDIAFGYGSSANFTEQMRIKGTGNVGIGKNNPAYKLDVVGDINASGQIRVNGVALTSDARFKQNVSSIPNALHNLLQLKGANYFFNTNAFPEKNFSSYKQMGVIAQDVEKVFPELVSMDKEGYKSVNYIGLIPVMIESIKEQQRQIDELKSLLNQLIKSK